MYMYNITNKNLLMGTVSSKVPKCFDSWRKSSTTKTKKGTPLNGEKIFVNNILDRGLISKIYNKSIQFQYQSNESN